MMVHGERGGHGEMRRVCGGAEGEWDEDGSRKLDWGIEER